MHDAVLLDRHQLKGKDSLPASGRLPRLPLEASIDLTYRCSNACRHCWLLAPDTPAERAAELTTGEWRAVVDQARALGTRRWSISGGEPMLRDDFAERPGSS